MFVFIFAWPRLWVYDGISDGGWGGIPVVSGIGEDLHRQRLIAINLSGDRGWARSPGCQKTERSRKSNYLFSSRHDFPSIRDMGPLIAYLDALASNWGCGLNHTPNCFSYMRWLSGTGISG